MLSTIPCSGFLYLQFLARCHPYILISFLMIFTLVIHDLCFPYIPLDKYLYDSSWISVKTWVIYALFHTSIKLMILYSAYFDGKFVD